MEVMAYILGKSEGEGEKWHGHVTAVTVAPEYRYGGLVAFRKAMYKVAVDGYAMQHAPYRRQRLAQKLMNDLEDITETVHKAYFVDLFVRVSNASAIQMYNKVRHCELVQLLNVAEQLSDR